LWGATRVAPPAALARWWARLPALLRWRGWRAALPLALLWIPLHGFLAQLPDDLHGHYHNDAIAFVHADADLWRQGHNPFTADAAFWDAARRWPLAYATPLLGGPAFGSDPLAYPNPRAQGAALHTALAQPRLRGAGNFDPRTIHNYPGGIIWLALPLIWMGLPSVVWLNFLALAALVAILLWRAPPALRPTVLAATLANPVMWLYSLLENYDVVCIVFIIASWLLWSRSRSSPLLLGLAAAIKQIAWFFIPFYLIACYRREGARRTLQRAGWLLAGFVVLNLPFIALSPGAWLRGLLVPQTDPLFPIGYGAMALGLAGALPLHPLLWTALEATALAGALVWHWRRPIPGNGLLLALVPLWFAWRSPMNYFALLPALAVACWLTQTPAAYDKSVSALQRHRLADGVRRASGPPNR
jgi:hypothetical protein